MLQLRNYLILGFEVKCSVEEIHTICFIKNYLGHNKAFFIKLKKKIFPCI